MPHLSAIAYSPFDQMAEADLGGGGTAYFVYGASGQRVRKVHEHSSSTLVEERIYLGGYELYRKHDSSGMLLERQTLHVMDGTRRVAMVETKTIEDDIAITDPEELWRFQLDNHLGSACLELDDAGAVISYEEYHPFGTSAYRAASASEVSERRYRYIGRERDEETGFYSMGVRYYAPWLGRWTTADPAGIGADGPGLYSYCRGNPVGLRDPNGREGVLAGLIANNPVARAVANATAPWAQESPPLMLTGEDPSTFAEDEPAYFSPDPNFVEVDPKAGRPPAELSAPVESISGQYRPGASPQDEPEVTGADILRALSPNSQRLIGPSQELQGLPPGLRDLHEGANTEVAQAGTQSTDVIITIGDIALTLQMAVGEKALVAGAGDALATGAESAPRVVVGRREIPWFAKPALWLLGAGGDLPAAAEGLPAVRKAVNSNLPHAIGRAVERGIFATEQEAATGLRELSTSITTTGQFPAGAIRDTAHLDRVLVPVGNNGMAVYQVGANGTAKLKTVLNALSEAPK
ncbi:MAG: RHS repeat-associated core domain-containing protein [Polyangiaceae bacterium]